MPTSSSPHVLVEMPRIASRRMRVAHLLARHTLRRSLNLAVRLDALGMLKPRWAQFLAGTFEALMVLVRPPRGTRVRRLPLRGFDCEWVWHRLTPDPRHVTDAAIVYLHGGALVSCGLRSHRRLVARISRASGVPVLNVAYRQIPAAHIVDTVDDCLQAYRHLLGRGFRAERIVVAGDSAGGGLAFALVLAARAAGLSAPAAIVAIAPWADYDPSARRAHPNDGVDPFLSADILALPIRWGMADDGVPDPSWSPVNHEFGDMPPVFMQVGSTEVLLADTVQLVDRCEAAGVPVRVQVWDRGVHVFQAAADVLPEGREAVAEIGEFIRDALGREETTG